MEYCNFLQFSSRKERFGRIMRDFDEMRNIDVDYEPRVIYKKSGGFLGKFVALLLGIIIGIAAGLGGLVGAGWYLYKKMPIEQVLTRQTGSCPKVWIKSIIRNT